MNAVKSYTPVAVNSNQMGNGFLFIISRMMTSLPNINGYVRPFVSLELGVALSFRVSLSQQALAMKVMSEGESREIQMQTK